MEERRWWQRLWGICVPTSRSGQAQLPAYVSGTHGGRPCCGHSPRHRKGKPGPGHCCDGAAIGVEVRHNSSPGSDTKCQLVAAADVHGGPEARSEGAPSRPAGGKLRQHRAAGRQPHQFWKLCAARQGKAGEQLVPRHLPRDSPRQ